MDLQRYVDTEAWKIPYQNAATIEQKRLAADLMECNMDMIKYLTQHTSLIFPTVGHMEANLFGNSHVTTYGESAERLETQAIKLCKNKYLLEKIKDVKKRVCESDIADILPIHHYNNPFHPTPIQSDLCDVGDQVSLSYYMGMVTVKEASEITGVKPNTIKQAAESERLINTKKAGKTWIVNVREVIHYWHLLES